MTMVSLRLDGSTRPAPARSPMAMARSKAEPDFLRSAGARLTVIFREGMA